jgi:serine protease Do
MQTNRTSFISGAGIGAIAAVLAGAGGYFAHAASSPAGAVNATPVPAMAGAPASFADIVQRVAPAVVSIDVEGTRKVAFTGQAPFGFRLPDGDDDEDSQGDLRRFFQQRPEAREAPRMQAQASGFFISGDGYIVTNNHVVADADKITVRTKDERTLTGRVIGRDTDTDLAVIKVEGSNFPFVSFEDRAKPRVGDWVVAVGNPFGLGGTATAGIVSAVGRGGVSDSSYVDYLQIDAPINRGNSGGPTFDLYGRVVGVNTAIFSPSGGSVGIGFDIPADVAAQVTRQLISNGKIVRGYIGAQIQNVTPEIADSLGISGSKGALVAEITPGGPSEKAGLKPGDVVLKINGRGVDSSTDLTRQVALVRPGEDIRLEVRRDGQVRQVTIHSGTRPAQDQLASNDTPGGPGGGPDQNAAVARVLGMRLAPNPSGGVTIQGVRGDSDAGQKGLQAGDVILRAGERSIATPQDLSTAVAEAKKDGRSSVLLMLQRGGRRTFIPLKVGEG